MTSPAVKEWLNSHPVRDEMYWKGAALGQFEFLLELRDMLREADPTSDMTVVSEHYSKSITLPVVKIECPARGVVIYARNNFYNWAITVESSEHIEITPSWNPNEPCHSVYFEGFDRGGLPVHPPYASSPTKYSMHLGRNAEFKGYIQQLVLGFLRLDRIGLLMEDS